jgi:hypothetical protein
MSMMTSAARGRPQWSDARLAPGGEQAPAWHPTARCSNLSTRSRRHHPFGKEKDGQPDGRKAADCSRLQHQPDGVTLLAPQALDPPRGLAQRQHVADRAGEVNPAAAGQHDQLGHVLGCGAAVAADLLLEAAEGGAIGDGQRRS